jgi:hypothetical protein
MEWNIVAQGGAAKESKKVISLAKETHVPPLVADDNAIQGLRRSCHDTSTGAPVRMTSRRTDLMFGH